MSEMPEIKVEVIRSGDIPLPVGELGIAGAVPAVANAFLALTGKRAARRCRSRRTASKRRWHSDLAHELAPREFAHGAAMTSRRRFLAAGPRPARLRRRSIGPARAQDYPTRPVRWLIGFAPGGPTDIVARIMGQHLSEKLGQPFVIETRPGAGGNLATQAVVSAAPDGYTLLGIGHFNAINAALYQKLPFDFARDIAPVAGMAQVPNVLVVHPSVPAKTVAEFIAYLKANPGKLSYASSGNGTSSHLAAELFKAMTGTSMQHVPYRGTGAGLIELLSGQVQVYFTSPVGSLQYVQEGKLRALAVTTATPSAMPARRADGRRDRAGLRGHDLVRRRRAEGDAGRDRRAAQPRDQRRPRRSEDQGAARRLGGVPFVVSPAQMLEFVAAEIERWGKAVKFSGAKVD